MHNKESRTGSLTSDLSVKALVSSAPDHDDQLIAALVKRLSSKASSKEETMLMVAIIWSPFVEGSAGTG